MTPQEFIQKELTTLAAAFSHIHIRYGFDAMIDTHIVQLDPVDEYYHNQALDNAWIPIAMSFDEQFEDSISFISSDSSLKLEQAEMEWNVPNTEFAHLDFYNKIIEPLLQLREIDFKFPNVELYESSKVGATEILNVNETVSVISKYLSPCDFTWSIDQQYFPFVIQKESLNKESVKNQSYAMAA